VKPSGAPSVGDIVELLTGRLRAMVVKENGRSIGVRFLKTPSNDVLWLDRSHVKVISSA